MLIKIGNQWLRTELIAGAEDTRGTPNDLPGLTVYLAGGATMRLTQTAAKALQEHLATEAVDLFPTNDEDREWAEFRPKAGGAMTRTEWLSKRARLRSLNDTLDNLIKSGKDQTAEYKRLLKESCDIEVELGY